ncbi:MAG: hypothetical protein KGL39_28960 [Patescibacteria group bacterium]|nr:hypothetical protein [Patescibacteria group bacterium]
MAEYGLFSDEGLVEGDFPTVEEARQVMATFYSPEDNLRVAEVCPDHREEERDGCEKCEEDESEEEEEEEGGQHHEH